MTQSQILNANFDWLQAGKKEVFPEYKIDNQKTVFDRIAKAKRSTFDRSKFTIVGSPTITDDGVIKAKTSHISPGVAPNDAIFIPNSILKKIGTKNWSLEWEGKFLSTPIAGEYVIGSNWAELNASPLTIGNFNTNPTFYWSLNLNNNGTIVKSTNQNTPYQSSRNGQNYKGKFEFKNGRYSLSLYFEDGTNAESYLDSDLYFEPSTYNLGLGLNIQQDFDLKKLRLCIDGVEVFNGNKTGIDQMTSTLEIPYTQSKTGAKIVDSVYRDRVQDMYEQFGYTHYYTIGDDDYTLQTVSNEHIVDSYYADNSFMELTADLSLTQGGGAVSGQTVNLKRPYKDNKYIATIGTSSKATNSFVASASGQWITKGKGVLG